MRLRQQVRKCYFGSSKTEIGDICLKDKLIDSRAPAEQKKKLLSTEQSMDGIVSVCLIIVDGSTRSEIGRAHV